MSQDGKRFPLYSSSKYNILLFLFRFVFIRFIFYTEDQNFGIKLY